MMTAFASDQFTVFIRISAQSRISAQARISAHPHPTPFHLPTEENWIRANKRLRRKRSFLQSILPKTLLCNIFQFCYYHLLFFCKINILHFFKLWKFNKRPASNKRPLSRSKNLISAQGGYSNKYGRFLEKLPNYPSPKKTFCPKWEVIVDVGLGEG